jgi:uncharacterized membrane protein (GlpM family)
LQHSLGHSTIKLSFYVSSKKDLYLHETGYLPLNSFYDRCRLFFVFTFITIIFSPPFFVFWMVSLFGFATYTFTIWFFCKKIRLDLTFCSNFSLIKTRPSDVWFFKWLDFTSHSKNFSHPNSTMRRMIFEG